MSQVPCCYETDTKVLVALGGNVTSPAGTPEETIRAALEALQDESFRLEAQSRLYVTPCFPAGAGPDFVNGAAVFRTSLSPQQVLERLHQVEARFGRERLARWSARTLDLDLLAHGQAVCPDEETFAQWLKLTPDAQSKQAPEQLILPHPRLQDRGFVLVPLADVAPDWRHPVLGESVSELLKQLPEGDKADIRLL